MESKHNLEISNPPCRMTRRVTSHYTWIEISKNAINHNINQYKKIIGNKILAPVIKANAYGHGLVEFAQVCQTNKNVGFLCTATLSEALTLRKHNITKPILVLSYIDSEIREIANQNISVITYDIDTIKKLDSIGKHSGKPCNVHIKIDTGLSRLGITPDKAIDFIKHVKTYKHVNIQGIWTHFAEAQSPDKSFTNQQAHAFTKLIKNLKNIGIQIPLIHASNTSSVSTLDLKYTNFCRIGVGLYGCIPSHYISEKTKTENPSFNLKPILTWKTKIFYIKEIPKDSFIGYDRTHQVKRDSKIAVLPVGFFEGYDRRFSNKGHVFIKGKLAPIVGVVCMNVFMVDVTDIKNVKINSEVILIGNISGVRLDDLANIANLNPREISTRLNQNIPRIILD